MSTTTLLMRLLLLLRLRFRRRERPEAHEPAAALDALLEGLDATLLGRRRAIAVSRHRWFNTGRLPGGSPGWCRANWRKCEKVDSRELRDSLPNQIFMNFLPSTATAAGKNHKIVHG